ncbi:hypothetical protein [Phocoenobacter skyensis]|uniref:Uncharacterized protein n=2 Tax=Phocoenobacter skyensis TaxID=97481 RepID=A0A1H8A7H3_9PAST|nr:hypothetical protein [Pasteurella skyensis]QLB23316.1 hypothetical protein A6B44_08900 [Pasteurella skyensis]SEM65739.1 hypothetical protein SAMN05444853_13715 [Pasteurella skyensis]
MAFASIMFENKNTDSVKEAPVGFSWTTLFFWFFPALFRGDFKYTIIMFVLAIFTAGISILIFPFIYNKLYIKDLMAAGYKAISVAKAELEFIESKLGFEIPKKDKQNDQLESFSVSSVAKTNNICETFNNQNIKKHAKGGKKTAKPTAKDWIVSIIFLIIVGVTIRSCASSKDDKAVSESAKQKQEINLEDKIKKVNLSPYDKKSYPKLFKKYKKRIKDIEIHRKKAALKAAMSEKCDNVVISELSSKSTLKNLRYFVDCENGERFELTEKDLKDVSDDGIVKTAPKANSETEYDTLETWRACKEMIQAEASPSEVLTFHEVLGTATRVNKNTGNYEIYTDFESKNAFGVEYGFSARCIFGKDGSGRMNFWRRND